jgi:hypothetical protein
MLMRASIVFCDIDGVICRYKGPNHAYNEDPELLPVVRTIRTSSLRHLTKQSDKEATVNQLRKLKIPYDEIIFNCGAGKRVLINDKKPNNNENTAVAINLIRDEGMANVII